MPPLATSKTNAKRRSSGRRRFSGICSIALRGHAESDFAGLEASARIHGPSPLRPCAGREARARGVRVPRSAPRSRPPGRSAVTAERAFRPYTLVAELTYRCPLRCVYCSNPVDHTPSRGDLDTATWQRVFREAEALGVVQL